MYNYANDSKANERNQLEKYPGFVVLNVEQDRVLIPKRINGLKHKSCHQRTEEGSPKGFQWKIVTHLYIQAI